MQWWLLLRTPNESVTTQCLKTKLFPYWAQYCEFKLSLMVLYLNNNIVCFTGMAHTGMEMKNEPQKLL